MRHDRSTDDQLADHEHRRRTWRGRRGPAPSLRGSRVARRAARSRLAGVVVAGVVMLVVVHHVRAADSTLAEWGDTSSVLVLRTDLPAGSRVSPGDVRLRTWPRSLVPDGALQEVDDRRVTTDVRRGEVLVEHRLAPPHRGELAAMLDQGEVAVRVPVAAPPHGVAPGDRVDVMAPLGGPLPDSIDTLQVGTVATDARVLRVEDSSVVLAVRRAQSAATTGAALGGLVALVVRR